MAIWNRVQSLIFGGAIGAAARTAIEPQIEPARQLAWSNNRNRVLEVDQLAELLAQGLTSEKAASDEAGLTGYDLNKLLALAQSKLEAPGIPEALELWRRGKISPELVDRALAKSKVEPQYWEAIKELFNERLSPQVVALAIVRGIIHDPGFLPVGPPSGVGKVRKFPTSPLDALTEAKGSGYDYDRLFVETAIMGRPMGPEGAAAAVFKSILDRVDFDRAIAEGDVRNEWADAIFENARPIPHPLDYVQAHLRGWRTEPEMLAGAHRSGMVDADTELLFKIHGRPPSWHQVWIGLQRGGIYDGPITDIDPAFLASLRQSDLRPEWYHLLWHSRYSYPSPFVLRSLTTSHAISQADAEQVLKYEGYEPTFATKIAEAWAGGTTTSAANNPEVKKAEGQLYTALHRSYVARESDANAVEPGLTKLGVTGQAQTDVLALWNIERALIHAELTPKAIRDAVNGNIVNDATGQPWTQADAVAALLARGYSQRDADTFLAE